MVEYDYHPWLLVLLSQGHTVELYQPVLYVLCQGLSPFGVGWTRGILLLVMRLEWVGGAWRAREVVVEKIVLSYFKAISFG